VTEVGEESGFFRTNQTLAVLMNARLELTWQPNSFSPPVASITLPAAIALSGLGGAG
jgi:hypothetical protein